MKSTIAMLGLCLLLNSCKTYTVSPENFRKQFTPQTNQLQPVKINNPFSTFETFNDRANQLESIAVVDKKGNPFSLKNSPALEMRVMLAGGQRKIFYFDTVTIENDTLQGSISRFFNLQRKVPFNQIVKIEIQDGGKNYHYIPPTPEEVIQKKSDRNFEQIGEILKSFDLKRDTVALNCKVYKNVFYANAQFEKSGSRLDIIYHLDDYALELITIREVSPFQDQVWWVNNFFVQKDQVFSENHFCLAKDENYKLAGGYKKYQFNKSLDTDFLKKVSLEVYHEILKNSN